MFRSKPRIDISSTDTLLGEGSRFEGRLQSKASLRIEGEIIGAASLIIAEGAVFEGSCKMESTCARQRSRLPLSLLMLPDHLTVNRPPSRFRGGDPRTLASHPA